MKIFGPGRFLLGYSKHMDYDRVLLTISRTEKQDTVEMDGWVDKSQFSDTGWMDNRGSLGL